MAKLTPDGVIGTLKDLSYYKMKRVDRIVVRKKGGPSKAKIEKAPEFDKVRKNNKEFGGRSTICSWIMHAIRCHRTIADYNIPGPLHSLMKMIQVMDDKSDLGKRQILLTRQPQLLQGLSFTRNHLYDSIVRAPLQFEISKMEGTAVVHIPALTPGINFFCPFYNPMFQVSANLGLVGDLFYKDDKYDKPALYDGRVKDTAYSEWWPVAQGCGPQTLYMKLPALPEDDHFTVILSVAIFVGDVISHDVTQQVPHIGAGKILGVA